MKKVVFFSLLSLIFASKTLNCAYGKNINGYSFYELNPKTNEEYYVDLNGDGENEKIYADSGNWVCTDGRWLYVRSSSDQRCFVIDIDNRDRYKELVFYGDKVSLSIDRYHSPSIWSNFDILPNDSIELGGYEVPIYGNGIQKGKRNGTLEFPLTLWNRKGDKLYIDIACVIQKNGDYYKLKADLSQMYSTTKKQRKLKVRKKLYVYKKSTLKKNKLKTVLNKGAYYKPLKIKFGKKITAIQIKYKKKKGWIFVKTKNFRDLF